MTVKYKPFEVLIKQMLIALEEVSHHGGHRLLYLAEVSVRTSGRCLCHFLFTCYVTVLPRTYSVAIVMLPVTYYVIANT